MPDIPAEAVTTALAAYAREAYCDGEPIEGDERVIWRTLEAAMPAIERDIRSRIAESLRRAAEGRREYAAAIHDDDPQQRDTDLRGTLLAAAASHESSAAIIEDPRNLLDAIPSWRWTDEEHASLREDEDDGR